MYIEGSEWSWISNCSLKKSILRLIRNQEAEACATENGNIKDDHLHFTFVHKSNKTGKNNIASQHDNANRYNKITKI